MIEIEWISTAAHCYCKKGDSHLENDCHLVTPCWPRVKIRILNIPPIIAEFLSCYGWALFLSQVAVTCLAAGNRTDVNIILRFPILSNKP